ncbi:hypothetical protein AVEN_147097-1 [Araneus ventricosus]|uniref:Uncharacterized protein n=1 Tax=Araneus ventricosus TaxID=182803 RepID=A0A4Y2J9I9_ARAVE|nr:hypothetical protein AVEN_147097-1 [Araneus ventricosus]
MSLVILLQPSKYQFPPTPIYFRARGLKPPFEYYTDRILEFLIRQSKWSVGISPKVGYPNFRAHRSSSHRIDDRLLLERSNLRGVGRS